MASAKKIDSLNLNHWKLCNKVHSCVFREILSELSDFARINLSKNNIRNSQTSSRSLQSSQIRHVNPAIYVESLNVLESKLHKDEFLKKKSNSAELQPEISNIYIYCDPSSSFHICRCGSLIVLKSFKTPSTRKTKSLHTIERRCKIDDQSLTSIDFDQPEVERFIVNGNKIIKISTSLSNYSLTQHDSGISVSQKQAYDEWIKKKTLDILQKKKEAYELELKKKNEEERLKQEKKKKEKKNHHYFLVWIEKKRKENIYKRIMALKKFELKYQADELAARTIRANKTYFKQWYLRKEQEREAQKKKEKLKLQKLDKERQKKLEESSKAFKNWREKTKNRAKPPTHGLLPHQQAKPKYVNPIPWIVDQITSVINESQIVNNEVTLNPIKSNV